MDLETLIAERDIGRAIHRFARAMDERDWAALDTVLLEDATADLARPMLRLAGLRIDTATPPEPFLAHQ